MSWHKVTLSTEQVENQEYLNIQRQFNALFIAAGAPKDMALFSGNLLGQDERHMYFPPGSLPYANSIISLYGGVECDKPIEKPTLLVGQAKATDLMFGG